MFTIFQLGLLSQSIIRGDREKLIELSFRYPQWAAGGFEEFLNIMNFYVFLIVWDNRVNKL